jgi:hypothetical protein
LDIIANANTKKKEIDALHTREPSLKILDKDNMNKQKELFKNVNKMIEKRITLRNTPS